MATPTLTTVGSFEMAVGYPGQLALLPGGDPIIETRVNSGATAIDFGAAVCRGTATTPGVIGAGIVAASGKIVIGFAVRALSEANTTTSVGTVNYPQYSEVPVLKLGYMWVLAAETVTEGDVVVAVVATPTSLGSATTGAADGTTRLTSSAVWQTSATVGVVGLIRVQSNI